MQPATRNLLITKLATRKQTLDPRNIHKINVWTHEMSIRKDLI